jgi:hypothetical protein
VLGAATLASGLMLLLSPDALALDATLLEGSPFADWTAPGVIATVVGGALLLAGVAIIVRGVLADRRTLASKGVKADPEPVEAS